MVEAEASAAEAEEPDEPDEPDPDDEPDSEPEASPQVASGPTEADLKRFESENTRHEKALGKIIGDDWSSFEPCGVCGGVGHLPGALNASVPFSRDPQTEPCSVCDGYGTTLTGAREPGMVTRACSLCQGAGWTTVSEQPDVQPVVTLVDASAPAEVVTPAENGPADPRVAELQAAGYIVFPAPAGPAATS
jgi:hypothetical protein